MTQEEKDLLLKDIFGRIPYGVKCSFLDIEFNNTTHGYLESFEYDEDKDIIFVIDGIGIYSEHVKPYLFPLSSMTEEQKKEISKRYNYHNYYGIHIEITHHSEGYWDNDTSCNLQDYLWLEDWYNKNHFDYRGLIEKGLAIDATNKNIY